MRIILFHVLLTLKDSIFKVAWGLFEIEEKYKILIKYFSVIQQNKLFSLIFINKLMFTVDFFKRYLNLIPLYYVLINYFKENSCIRF